MDAFGPSNIVGLMGFQSVVCSRQVLLVPKQSFYSMNSLIRQASFRLMQCRHFSRTRTPKPLWGSVQQPLRSERTAMCEGKTFYEHSEIREI
jgi:hypothetical protein